MEGGPWNVSPARSSENMKPESLCVGPLVSWVDFDFLAPAQVLDVREGELSLLFRRHLMSSPSLCSAMVLCSGIRPHGLPFW